MSTLADMRSRIEDDLDRSDLAEQIHQAINRAVRYYAAYYFWFTQATAQWQIEAGQGVYSLNNGLPFGIQAIEAVYLLDNNAQHPLFRQDLAVLQQMSHTTGKPCCYAWYAQKMHYRLIPDKPYWVEMHYIKRYEPLTADNQTHDFLTEAEDLIEARALWWMNQRILKDDRAAQAHKAEEREALRGLLAQTDQIVLSKRFKPTNF